MADEVDDSDFEEFMASHLPQLQRNEIPAIYWKALHRKLKNEDYDAGHYFSIMQEEEEGANLKVIVTNDDGVQASDSTSVFLIDHAWTYEVKYAKAQLETVPGLANRMAALMGVEVGNDEGCQEHEIEQILEWMWCFNQTYQFRMLAQSGNEVVELPSNDAPEDRVSLWYVLDEFGSRIHHSDEPTCMVALLYYIPMRICFTIMWPTRDLVYGDELTRDYIPDVKDPLQRTVRLLPWQLCDIDEDMDKKSEDHEKKKGDEQKGLIGEIFPDESNTNHREPKDGVYRVFVTIEQITQYLTHPKFSIVENEEDADILWLVKHWKDFRSLGITGQYVNQFPAEAVLTCKDLLADLCQRSAPKHDAHADVENDDLLCRGPYWLPVTFNLNTELPQFVQHYKRRKKRGLDNHWICKPWNLGRGLDIHITRNVNQIIRLVETGPKVACKYIDKQVLFERDDVGPVKFDVRYMLFVTSAKPLVLYVDRVFWIRFANKPFSLDHFEEYERHCTVMNYGTYKLKQIHHYEFIPMFNSQYPNHKWESIEVELFEIFKELMQAAVKTSPPEGLGPCHQSRATYGIDVMVKWADDGSDRMIPQVIEMNFNPDCQRICKYYPEYYNFVFSQLFLDDSNGWPVERLL